MRPTLYTVVRAGAGSLSTMAHPRGGDWLDTEMSGLRDAGVDVLVCALTAGERAELGLAGEQVAAGRAGLNYLAFPIPDRGVPDSSALVALADALIAELGSGHHVVAHCRFGIGRSSLIAATVLVREGVASGVAWQRVTDARGLTVPDTEAQRRLVESLGPRA